MLIHPNVSVTTASLRTRPTHAGEREDRESERRTNAKHASDAQIVDVLPTVNVVVTETTTADKIVVSTTTRNEADRDHATTEPGAARNQGAVLNQDPTKEGNL